MGKLREEEFWCRIRGIEGTRVYTIQQRRENAVVLVTDSEVHLQYPGGEPRATKPTRHQLWATYSYVWDHRQVTHDDFDNIPGNLNKGEGAVSRIILAILRDAVPDQIEAFKRDEGKQSGIRVRQNPG